MSTEKLSELKDALEFLETTEFDGEWDSALVGGENGENYHAVINANDVVVRAADDSRHTSWLCDYLEAVSPVNIRALLAELEAKELHIAELESHVDVAALALSIAELRIYGEDHDNCPASLSESIDLVLHEIGRIRAELVAKDKRIADMERVVAAAKCDDELWDAMAHRLKTLEARLATPVQLPTKFSMLHRETFHSNYQTQMVFKADEVTAVLHAAGFTFTVEGGE